MGWENLDVESVCSLHKSFCLLPPGKIKSSYAKGVKYHKPLDMPQWLQETQKIQVIPFLHVWVHTAVPSPQSQGKGGRAFK